MTGGSVGTDTGIAPVLPVSIPVGGAVGQYLGLRTNHTVVMLVIYILPPLVAALYGLRPLVLSLHKQPAVRIRHAPGHGAQLLLSPGQIFPGCIVSGLLLSSRRLIIVVVNGLPSTSLLVYVDFFH